MKTRLALLLPLLALAACKAENNASVRLAMVCAPPDDAAVCSFAETCEAEFIGQTFVEVTQTNHLWTFVQVDNQRPDNTDEDTFRTNTSTAFVQEYDVEYVGLAGMPPVNGAPILGSATVPSEGSAVISIRPIPESVGNFLLSDPASPLPAGAFRDVVAKVTLRGVYGSTDEFETGEYEIPIRLCNGTCVVAFPPCATATDVRFLCPFNPGQAPISTECAPP
jgi:hypothetical protein